MKRKTYSPQEFVDPRDLGNVQFEGALGSAGWELVAAEIVIQSQQEGKWVYVNRNYSAGYDIDGAIKAGILTRTRQGIGITSRALEKIAERYLIE